MQELEIINILKENDLSDVEVLKNEEEYVLVNFYFDFDKDLQDAAKDMQIVKVMKKNLVMRGTTNTISLIFMILQMMRF